MASLLFIGDSFSDYSEVECLGTHEPRTVDSLIRKQIQQVGGLGRVGFRL
jgi:hypothetical protein